MFTDVVISGETYNFLIDTGAPFVLSPELAKKVGFRSTQKLAVGSSNNLTGVAQFGNISAKVELGGLKFSGFQVLVVDYNANTSVIRCLDMDGIIGANFMDDAIWHFDYDQKQVLITNSLESVPRIKNAWKTKMKKVGIARKPFIAARVNNGKRGRVLFDTGYSGFFDLPYLSYYRALQKGKLPDNLRVLEGYGSMAEGVFGAEDTTGFFIESPWLTIGKERMRAPIFEMSHMDNIKVGSAYLKGRLVTFDFLGSKLYVYEKSTSYVPVNERHYLIRPRLEGGSIRVGALYGHLQDSGELELGDLLVSVNGRQLSDYDPCEALMWLRMLLLEGTEPIDVQIERNGELHRIRLEKHPIFID